MRMALALVIFVPLGMLIFFGAFYALCTFLDWSCRLCLERESDDQSCCE